MTNSTTRTTRTTKHHSHRPLRVAAIIAIAAVATMGFTAAPAAAANYVLGPGSALYVDPHSTTLEAAAGLSGQARTDAQLLGSFPSATWFTKGTPAEAQAAAHEVTSAAAASGAVPTVVVYNLPYRDCAQYSAGGALDTAAYEAWVDGVAAGIGDAKAAIVLEPDGLGIIPWHTDINGNLEWCQPADLDPATAASDRFEQVNHAVDVLTALPNTAVYLDGTHSGWLGVGDISQRLIAGGVEKADGFFLNASNYVQTERLAKYGTWVSDCINLSVNSWYEPSYCGSQYYPASPDDFSTWGKTDAQYAQAYIDTGLTPDPAAQAHFVIDTSRNGVGPWAAPAGWEGDAEVWCNPPDRGAGARPTTDTGNALIDAYLWIKVPGESDGQCYRGTGGPLDPVRGIEDPAAGQWFAQQARELIANAVPAFPATSCQVSYSATKALFGVFAAELRIRNTGTTAINGWTLKWNFAGSEKVVKLVGGKVTQAADAVTLKNSSLTAKIKAGASVPVAFVGSNAKQRVEPWLFTLNGKACASD